MHPRNTHQGLYNLKKLTNSHPNLKTFIELNRYGNESINFFNPDAVKALNTSILFDSYGLKYWDFPEGYLCPPIPGRVDYIHYLADLLSEANNGVIPKGKQIKCLDIGTGANCIYPILGNSEYEWAFIGSDIDFVSVVSATKIINLNPHLKGSIDIRLQENSKHIFSGIIKKGEFFNLTICNPPFHKSRAEAKAGSTKKLKNLNAKAKPLLNFSGQNNELWCKGGEKMFIKNMIKESLKFSNSCQWFTTLVSKRDHLNSFYDLLKKVKARDVRTIEMAQGHKKSRILAWSFKL